MVTARRFAAGRTLVAVAVATAALASGAAYGDTRSTPAPGLTRVHRRTSNQNINILIIDLCRAGVSLRATKHGERGRTPSSFGSLVGAHAAINGDFFRSGYATDGMAAGGGALWAGSRDHAYVTPVAVGSHRIEIPHHNNITAHAGWMANVVSGHPTLLDDGKTVGNPGDPLCTNRHPRTAIGISQDHKRMIWAVVDGRRSTRIGMTCPELANLMREFGAFDAVNMDGGGSSAMWIRGVGVAGYPSDGSQRVVGNHLAVIARGSGAAAHCPCKRRCSGDKIIDEHCNPGNCALFAATCADDKLGVRCVSAFCPALGTTKTCLPDGRIADCVNGGLKNAKKCGAGTSCKLGKSSASCVAPPPPEPDSGGSGTKDAGSAGGDDAGVSTAQDAGAEPSGPDAASDGHGSDDVANGGGGSAPSTPGTSLDGPRTMQGGCGVATAGRDGADDGPDKSDLPAVLVLFAALVLLALERRRRAG